MPRRTNTFQQFVKLVHELMAEGATVEESVILPDKDTGDPREIDVLITGEVVPGMKTRIQIEATAQAKPVDVKWVEKEIGLHEAVGTDQLILISEAGFTAGARSKAEAKGAVLVEPRDLGDEDKVGEVVNRLGSIWPKVLALTPTHIAGLVLNPEGKLASAKGLSLDTLIVTDNGEELGTIRDEIERRLNERFPDVANEIGLGEIAGDVEAYFEAGIPDFGGTRNGERFVACLRWQPDPSNDPEFHPIVEIKLQGKAAITVAEIELTHRQLGQFAVSYGAGKVGDKDAVLVVTEDEGTKRGLLHFPETDA